MTKGRSATAEELPHLLIQAIKEERAVLILGAGASKQARDANGKSPPTADELRDILATKFLGTSKDKRDLSTVAEMAIANGAGEPLVFEEIARVLSQYQSSNAHLRLAEFRWRGLVTTNYDTLIERGYAAQSARKQTCIPFVKDLEPFDDRLRSVSNPVPLIKLHGCIDHRLDPDIPLVLSHEHYHRYSRNRIHLFTRLQQWAQHSVLIFLGYRIGDAHIRSLLYEIDPGKRPQWYLVSPNADEHDVRFWATKSVDVLPLTFEQFTNAIDRQIPNIFRSLAQPIGAEKAPYIKHFRTSDLGSDALRQSLRSDISYVYGGMPFDEFSAAQFYSGYDDGWCGIVRNYDFSRKTGEKLIYDALDEANPRQQRFYLLQGAAGSGKTIALKRAAYDAAYALDKMVFWLNNDGALRADVFEELYGLTGQTAHVFVDQVSLHFSSVLSLLAKSKERGFPITIISAERDADWTSYCGDLERTFPPQLFTLGNLSEREVEDLVDLLERHKCLGLLESKGRDERIASFLDKDRSDRQLLVALHELTQGKPFEQIIEEEYLRIIPEAARRLYLDIATMHQFGVIARAGAVSRISGIRFADFEERFFLPLKNIVRVSTDRVTGDKGYEARHPRVSKMVFEVACIDDESKAAQFSRIITGLDAGFSSDKRIIEGVCKGRALSSQFSRVDPARAIFDAAIEAVPSSAFVYQQAAILEYTHNGGSLDRSQKLAEKAREIDPNNHIYLHTLAEVARRKANSADSAVRAAQLRAQSRKYLNEIRFREDPRKDLSFCNLLVDEALEFLNTIGDNAKEHEVIEFDVKVDDAMERLRRAQAEYPGESEFSVVEGRLWQRLGENERASKAFRRAIAARPKNSGVFARLSRIERQTSGIEEAINTLESALEKFPTDKNIHLALALQLIETADSPTLKIENHLRSSFSVGDNNFDARYCLGEYLFWAGKPDECFEVFEQINERAPASFRRLVPKHDDVITLKLGTYAGSIDSVHERFMFIRFGGYRTSIFGHMDGLFEAKPDDISVGMNVSFRLRFNRRGPAAVQILPKSSLI